MSSQPGPARLSKYFAGVAGTMAILWMASSRAAGGKPTPSPFPEASPAAASERQPAVVTALAPEELQDFSANSPAVRRLLEQALALTTQNLTYRFGSSDPAAGGMDCSGTIFHLLRSVGIDDVPRSASEQYVWARKAGTFQAVVSRDMDTFELDDLHPGDLLFWTGTYATPNDPPVTHTMIYLGRLKADGRQVMFGASDGRTYGGKKMWGVSVFDFLLPKPRKKSAAGPGSVFIGYARIPGLERAAPAVTHPSE
jgi:cell wall-associated NlpC family hydrolase